MRITHCRRLYLSLCAVLLLVQIGGAAVKHVPGSRTPMKPRTGVQMKTPENSKYLPDKIIVKLRQTPLMKAGRAFGVNGLDKFVQRFGVRSIDAIFPNHAASPVKAGEVDLSRFYVLHYSNPIDPFALSKELSKHPDVEYAEPWYIYPVDASPQFTPSDTSFLKQWSLKKIKADSAWNVTQGDSTIIIGIDDSGTQWDHPDLIQNIWYNPGEMGLDSLGHDKRTNGIDDDGDGKIDDWHGWDFAGPDYNNPTEDNEPGPTAIDNIHGTHVAGIAGATTNNVTGIAGVGFKCRILPIKVAADNNNPPDQFGSPQYWIIAGFQGIIYAADMGATVVNCSWGGTGYSQYEQDVINYATAKGTLVVASAGNDGKRAFNFPASYDNVISVAATDKIDAKTTYSTFSPSVDVCAPGGDNYRSGEILSTIYPSSYGVLQGTSQAAPHVTGLAGLVKSVFPSYTAQQIGEQIRVTCDDNSAINSSYYQQLGKGRINAYAAVTATSSPSIRITDIVLDDSLGGNNDGFLQPNEIVNLKTTFANFLHPTSTGATVTLVAGDTTVQVLHGTYNLGALGTLLEKTVSDSTFQIRIKTGVPNDHIVYLTYNISDVGYSDYQTIGLSINPSYATLNINNIKLTVTREGRLGFNDFDLNTEGVGFYYGNGNQLFEGGLMVGYSPARLVDEFRNETAVQDNDFTTAGVFSILTPGLLADQEGTASFTDAGAPAGNKVGLSVSLHTYAYSAPPNQDYILLRYDLTNSSGADLTNVYAGLFLDWDILPPGTGTIPTSYFAHNKTTYDASRNLGYAWYDTTAPPVYCGARSLTGTGGYYGLRNDSITGYRADKWSWLTSGAKLMTATTDVSMAIASGPYTIANNGTETVGFALVAGTGLPAFQAHADSALVKWQAIFGANLGLPHIAISIHQNPAFTRFADMYVASDSDFTAVPSMTVDNGGGVIDTVVLAQFSSSVRMYKGPYQFTSSGSKTIRVHAQTPGGHDTTVTRTFHATQALPGATAFIQDPTGLAVLQIPSGAVTEETYFLSSAGDAPAAKGQRSSRVYSFSPARNFTTSLPISVGFADIASWKGKERYVHLYRIENNQRKEISAWLDPARRLLHAEVTQLGDFVLGLDELTPARELPTEFSLSQNYPNPFNPQTAIRFALPSDARVRIRIFNVLGEEVKLLLDGDRPAGMYEVRWDGTGAHAAPLSSGIYFYRIDAVHNAELKFSSTKKMILMK